MRGSVTRISRDGAGSILAEDGKEVDFERSGASRNGVDDLRLGHWVEFELQYGFELQCAVTSSGHMRCVSTSISTGLSVDRGLAIWS
jgi:cold shock CspA family protein